MEENFNVEFIELVKFSEKHNEVEELKEMMDKKIYNDDFHKNRDELTDYSAKKISNILLDLIEPQSVCDVGGDLEHGYAFLRKLLC